MNVILLLFVIINTVKTQTEECENITTSFQTYDTLLNCINSIPFDESIKQQTLTTLSTILPSYVFIDSLLQSPDPINIPLSVNLTNSLILINETSYSTDASVIYLLLCGYNLQIWEFPTIFFIFLFGILSKHFAIFLFFKKFGMRILILHEFMNKSFKMQ